MEKPLSQAQDAGLGSRRDSRGLSFQHGPIEAHLAHPEIGGFRDAQVGSVKRKFSDQDDPRQPYPHALAPRTEEFQSSYAPIVTPTRDEGFETVPATSGHNLALLSDAAAVSMPAELAQLGIAPHTSRFRPTTGATAAAHTTGFVDVSQNTRPSFAHSQQSSFSQSQPSSLSFSQMLEAQRLGYAPAQHAPAQHAYPSIGLPRSLAAPLGFAAPPVTTPPPAHNLGLGPAYMSASRTNTGSSLGLPQLPQLPQLPRLGELPVGPLGPPTRLGASDFSSLPARLVYPPSFLASGAPLGGLPQAYHRAAAGMPPTAFAGAAAGGVLPDRPSAPVPIPAIAAAAAAAAGAYAAPVHGTVTAAAAGVTPLSFPLRDDLEKMYQEETTGPADDPTRLKFKDVRETGAKWYSPLDVSPTVQEVVAAARRVYAGPEDDCSVCLERFAEGQEVLQLHKCQAGHYFHAGCIEMALKTNMRCPNCTKQYGMPSGQQPPGRMAITLQPFQLPGETDSFGTYMIAYQFPTGIQSSIHPSPGEQYTGTSRRAYIPATPHGRRVLSKFLRAWDARLLFTVGTSITTGRPNCVIWNGIHHKTSVAGGPVQFGFPDPDYLTSVEAELASVGIN